MEHTFKLFEFNVTNEKNTDVASDGSDENEEISTFKKDNNTFVRKGNDLHYKCDIGFIDSVIGKDITIPYFKETIKINTQQTFGVICHSKKYLIEGKGLPVMNTSNKGNMYVEFNVNYPKIKDNTKMKELKELLEEMF